MNNLMQNIEKFSSSNDGNVEMWFFLITIFSIIFIAIFSSVIFNNFKKTNLFYSKEANSSNKTGAEIAKEILHKNNIKNVKVLIGEKEGVDHYNPRTNQIVLSPSVYSSRSISAAAIAAHETGHAIQWGKKELGIRVRDSLTKPVQIATQVSNFIFMFAFIFMFFVPNVSFYFTLAGILMYGSMGLFQLVTLPIEFGASKKAIKELEELKYINSSEEKKGTKKVLNSAAMTYVLAFFSSLVFLLIFVLRLFLNSRN